MEDYGVILGASRDAGHKRSLSVCFYAAAQDACRATKTRLKALDLTANELDSIKSTHGLDVLIQKIQQTIDSQEQSSSRHPATKKAGQFVEIFSEFVTRTSGIIELLVPQSPEYRMTYGVLLLVFKTVFKGRETQESLLTYIQTLSARLPIVDFYSKVFPSNGVKIRVVSIYVEILNLLNEAIVYYRSNHLRQLRDAVLRPVETKFDKCIQRIDAEVEKLHELKEAAHVAQQADIKELLESTSQVVGHLHDNLTQPMTALSYCLTLLDARIETLTHQSSATYTFHAANHALALTEVLLPTASTAAEQLSPARNHHLNLSPKDHCYETAVLKAFDTWSAHGRSELWIGGRSGNQDTWITEMSIDLIDALQMQNLALLHMFCTIADAPSTLLDRHPEIPFRQPSTYNIHRFRRAKTFARLWTIFEALVTELASSVFVLVDRIEECDGASDDEDGGDHAEQLLPYLIGLASEAEHVSVIVTSTYGPPEGLVGEEESRHFYQDTGKSRGKREYTKYASSE
ncbi:hypothetical protein P171DRAFT_481163 [Karstenula rhodostoma CBS 690.94]|uniref:DUF7708 domain-containing protein n=1 Tax=Karstenula rhodostoma CBS 690.94 TaxID=1392251 RepID=A0A9P4PVR1_9PLEO|nr:hypothetical protein P171DRAFT_481163 [Karstenula rhodostoma CBS 690.94]